MANRYWVGGTGTWNTTSTTNWSATSGLTFTASCSGTTLTTVGSPALVIGMRVWSSTFVTLGTITGGSGNTWTVSVGGTYASQAMQAATTGASVPTSADDVFFDKNLTYSVTLTGALNCRNWSVTASSGLATFVTGTTPTMSVYGDVSWNLSRIAFSGAIFGFTFTGAGTKTILTNNVSVPGNPTGFSTGTYNLASDFLCGNINFQSSAIFNTNNYSVQVTSMSGTGTINAGSSQFTSIAATIFAASSNITFNAGTSLFRSTAVTTTLHGSAGTSHNFYDFVFNANNTSPGTITINGNNTFNNLTVNARAAVGLMNIVVSGTQTVSNVAAINYAAPSAFYRALVASATLGTTATIDCPTWDANGDAVDFRDITISGAAAPISGLSFGDCGGNSGITFAAPATLYRSTTSSGSYGATAWATSIGGTATIWDFPLAQDTAVFPVGYPVAASTITMNGNYQLGTIDMSARTSSGPVATMTFATATTTPSVYGDWINGTGTTLTGTASMTFIGRDSQSITGAGRTFTQALTINTPGGTLTAQDDITSSGAMTLNSGALDLSGYTLSVLRFSSDLSSTRSIAFGSTGQINCTGTGAVWSISSGATFSSSGNQVVNITSAGSTAITVIPGTSVSEADALNFNFTGGTYPLTFLSSSGQRTKNIDFTGYAGSWGGNISSPTCYGSLILSSGMTLANKNGTMIFAPTSGGTHFIKCAGNSIFGTRFTPAEDQTYQFQDNFDAQIVQLDSGTLDANDYAVTAVSFQASSAVDLGSATWTITGSGLAWLVVAASVPITGSGTISMTSASAKSFFGGGVQTYPTLNQGGSGVLTIAGSNKFANITNTVQPTTVRFTSGTTTTLDSFSLAGTAGNLVTVEATSTSRASVRKSSSWYVGANSIDGGNNIGLTFLTAGSVDYLSISYINASVIGPSPGNFFVFF